jgi:hypothetical protein
VEKDLIQCPVRGSLKGNKYVPFLQDGRREAKIDDWKNEAISSRADIRKQGGQH